MRITLQAGLTLRCGQRTLEVVRLLEQDEVQLEDSLTRRASVTSTSRLLKRIWSGDLKVVQGGIDFNPDEVSDAALAKQPASSSVDLRDIPAKWRDIVERRMRYIRGAKAAHVSRADRVGITKVIATVSNGIGDAKPPSTSTLIGWIRRYETSEGNPMALVSRTSTKKPSRRLHSVVEQKIADYLRTQYLTKAQNPIRHVHDCLQGELDRLVKARELEKDQAKVSIATLYRRVAEIDAYQRISTRQGHARARMACRTTMDGADASYPLQRVEVDHTPLNWIVICDRTSLPLGRPLLTVARDAHSGYILGIYLTFYGAGMTSVCGVLRNSVEPKGDIVRALKLKNPWLSHGVGDEWVLDNGLEFHSKALRSISWELGINLTYCRVRTPWLKPHVERFFADLNYLTLQRGRVRPTEANILRVDPYKDASIGFADLVRGLLMFVVDVQPFIINERKLARPFELFQEGLQRCPPASFPGSLEQLRLASGLSKELTVGPGGVELLRLPYGGAELLELNRRYGRSFKTTCKWDPDDLGSIYVQDPDDTSRWITSPCRWGDYAQGLSWNQHRLIRHHARKRLAAKNAREVLWRARLELHDHWMDCSRKRTRADSQLAGKISGLTSSRVLQVATSPSTSQAIPQAEQSQCPMPVDDHGVYIVPEFGDFDLEDA